LPDIALFLDTEEGKQALEAYLAELEKQLPPPPFRTILTSGE